MFSTTADDGTIITARAYPTELLTRRPNSDFETFTAKLGRFLYTYTNDLIVRAIQQQYVDWSTRDVENTNYFYDFVRVSTDEGFLCPADYTARVYAEANLPVYRALFNHLPKYSTWPDPFVKWRGIAHSEDNPYTFGRGFNPERGHVFTLQEEDLSLNMMQYYTNFAKTGYANSIYLLNAYIALSNFFFFFITRNSCNCTSFSERKHVHFSLLPTKPISRASIRVLYKVSEYLYRAPSTISRSNFILELTASFKSKCPYLAI